MTSLERGFRFVALAGGTAVASDGSNVFVYERNPATNSWSEVKLLTSVAGGSAQLAIHGDTIVVGTPFQDNGAGEHKGAAYIFERDSGGPGNWGLLTTLSVGIGPDSTFGRSVALDATTLAISTNTQVALAAAFVFERSGGTWTQTDSAVVFSSINDLALDADTLVVGNGSAASIFGRDQGGTDTWGLVTTLSVPGAESFGRSVTVHGDTAAVGLRDATGGVYVFERDLGGAGAWGQRTLLTASDAVSGDQFGSAVRLRGALLLVGAPSHPGFAPDAPQEKGAVYTFGRDQGGADAWGQIQKLELSDGVAEDEFGLDIDLTGNALVGFTAIIGASFDNHREEPPAAYIFGNTGPQSTVLGVRSGIASGTQSSLLLANVSDGEDAPETLAARIDGGTSATTNGVSVSNLAIEADGDVFANVAIACGASDASFELSFSDGLGLVTTSTLTIETEPSAPPVIQLGAPASLGSPNHKYRSLAVSQLVASATDDCDGNVAASVAIEQITSDEPDDVGGGADGSTRNDAVLVDCRNLRLRAERNELGNGRVYGITLRAADSEGRASRAVFSIGAPVESKGSAVEDAPALVVPGCP